MSIIKSIDIINDDCKLGYEIKTTGGGIISITMSNGSLCCETYYAGVLFEKQNVEARLNEWVGKTVSNIYVSEKQGFVYRLQTYKDNDEYAEDEELAIEKANITENEFDLEDDIDARYRTVSVYTEDCETPLVFYLYNCHNSFYPHRCIIRWRNLQGGLMEGEKYLSFRL